jgi:hypothetical protein
VRCSVLIRRITKLKNLLTGAHIQIVAFHLADVDYDIQDQMICLAKERCAHYFKRIYTKPFDSYRCGTRLTSESGQHCISKRE